MCKGERPRGAAKSKQPRANPPAPPETKVTIVGKDEIYQRENLVGPLLVHNVLVPRPPPPPSLPSNDRLVNPVTPSHLGSRARHPPPPRRTNTPRYNPRPAVPTPRATAAGACDSTQVTLYINGIQQGSGKSMEGPPQGSSLPVIVGGHMACVDYPTCTAPTVEKAYYGSIDDVRVLYSTVDALQVRLCPR